MTTTKYRQVLTEIFTLQNAHQLDLISVMGTSVNDLPSSLAESDWKYIVESLTQSPTFTTANNDDDDTSTPVVTECTCGFPEEPYVNSIANVIGEWAQTKQFPIRFQPIKDLEQDEEYYRTINSQLTPIVLSLDSATSHDDQIKHSLHLFAELGIRGILTCLRLRKTAGSIPYFPPSTTQLYAAFNDIQNKTGLTVGARALAKHCHRAVSDNWWGKITGSVKVKNQHAVSVLDKILATATFTNAHILPHSIPCFEVRNHLGYGARWVYKRGNPEFANEHVTDNTVVFRGFLEPHSNDGHEKGWVH